MMKLFMRGFSLLEITITIVIIGILAVLAIPGYREPVAKSQQIFAKTALLALASEMQYYYTTHRSYQGISLAILGIAPDIPNTNYHLEILSLEAEQFAIAAVPQKQQVNASCGTFILDQNGNKNISGSGNISDCW
jgi:type IV pilus assembly protein PilE